MELSEISDKIIETTVGPLTYPTLVLRIIGLSPLLMNNPTAMGLPATKNPEEDAKARAYWVQDGVLGVPAGAIRASICNGGTGFKYGRSALGPELFKKTLVDEQLRPLERAGSPIGTYRVDARRCVVQRQGITRGRPAIDVEWSFSVAIMWDIDARYPSEDAAFAMCILNSAKRAGKGVGILDFRPQHKGSFGRYMVEVI